MKTPLTVNTLRLALGIFALLVVFQCSEEKENAVPKPRALPRMAVTHSDSMVQVTATPVKVLVNPMATYIIEDSEHPGLTVTYPKINTDIYFTFIDAPTEEQKKEIIALRQERINLNLNGIPAQTFHGTDSEGTEAVVVVAQSGSQTPVQMLAVSPRYIVTATAFIHDPSASLNYDSIVPVYEVVKEDLMQAIPGIKFSN